MLHLHQTYFSTFIGDENGSPHFERGGGIKNFDILNSNPGHVAYHWKALLTKKNNDA